MTTHCQDPLPVPVWTWVDLAKRLFGQLEWMEQMKNSTDVNSSKTALSRRRGNSGLLIGILAALAVVLIIWVFMVPGSTDPSGSIPSAATVDQQANETSGNIDVQTNDVDAVTEAAELPVDDAEPNPVVPQDAVIPPAEVDDAPPD